MKPWSFVVEFLYGIFHVFIECKCSELHSNVHRFACTCFICERVCFRCEHTRAVLDHVYLESEHNDCCILIHRGAITKCSGAPKSKSSYHIEAQTTCLHFPDDICKWIDLNENNKDKKSIRPKISLKFVPKSPINNIASLVQIMAWRRPGNKPLSEPMMVSLLNWRINAPLGLNELKARFWIKDTSSSNVWVRYFFIAYTYIEGYYFCTTLKY